METEVLILSPRIKDLPSRATIMAYYYSFFIIEPEEDTPEKEILASVMLGLLFNTVNPTRILANNNELQNFCIKAGFSPTFLIVTTDEEITQLSNHPRIQRFFRKFGDGLGRFFDKREQQLVMFRPIMLTLGKNIQAEGYDGWITKRIRAFMGTLGISSADIIWTQTTYPTLAAMSVLSTYLSASYHFRREVFRVCWATALNQGNLSNIFKDIISLLKGSSMTHIILIDEYVYSRFKEFLSLRMLADNHKGMIVA